MIVMTYSAGSLFLTLSVVGVAAVVELNQRTRKHDSGLAKAELEFVPLGFKGSERYRKYMS